MGLLGNFIKSNVDVVIEFADGVGPYVVGDKVEYKRIFLGRVNQNNLQVKGQAILSMEKEDVKVRKIVLRVSGEQKLTVNFVEYSNSEDGEDVRNTAENVKY